MSPDSPGAEQSQPVSESTEVQAARPAQRILIGSQREGDTGTEAKAKPVTPPAPFTAPPATPSDTPPAGKPMVKRQAQQQHYPPPNIRDQLSPELEAEYQAALGELSFDSLMSEGVSADTAIEIPAESRVTGRVAKVSRDNVFIELSSSSQGIVPLRQFTDLPKEGDTLELNVVRFDGEEGLYELTLPTAAVNVGNWDEVTEGQIIEVNITAHKGGLECQIAGIRGFIPMGQVSIYRVEHPEELVGQRMACVVTEANRDRRNLVLSHRAVMDASGTNYATS